MEEKGIPTEGEEFSECSDSVVQYLESLLGNLGRSSLVSDILESLKGKKQRLPLRILIPLLQYGHDCGDYIRRYEIGSALFAILGEREMGILRQRALSSEYEQGLLLSQGALYEEEVEALWEKGELEQRLEILSQWRTQDPDLARQRLEAVYFQEKPGARIQFLEVMAEQIVATDEDFLERALDDISREVRIQASICLSFIPESLHVKRVITIAEKILQKDEKQFSPILPKKIPKEWTADGFIPSRYEKYTIIFRVASTLPLSYWEQRFQLDCQALLKVALHSPPISQELLLGWSKAAVREKNLEWCRQLYMHWQQQHLKDQIEAIGLDYGYNEVLTELFEQFSQEEQEALLLPYLFDAREPWGSLLHSIPGPWSASFSRELLARIKAYVVGKRKEEYYEAAHAVNSVFHPLITSCSVECLDELQVPWSDSKNSKLWLKDAKPLQQTLIKHLAIKKELL